MRIQLDARSEDGKIAVEAYARQGQLKAGQRKKVAQDVLKLALLGSEQDHADVRSIIVFASEEARSSVTGWVQRAAEVVDIDADLRETIVRTQRQQTMTNVALSAAADDLTIEE